MQEGEFSRHKRSFNVGGGGGVSRQDGKFQGIQERGSMHKGEFQGKYQCYIVFKVTRYSRLKPMYTKRRKKNKCGGVVYLKNMNVNDQRAQKKKKKKKKKKKTRQKKKEKKKR